MTNSLEEKLLICCARTYLNEGGTGEVRRILSRNLDWDHILKYRPFFNVSPLLFYNLKKIANDHTVPRYVMDELRARYIHVLRRNLQTFDQLREVLEVLENEGIPVILLKGAALAETVYPDIALRPMSDIDLLFKEADLRNVAKLLSELGYSPVYLNPVEYYEEHHHLAPYQKSGNRLYGSVTIEVHHNIAPEPLMSRISVDCLWEDPQNVSVAKTGALVLSPENLLMHLCIHFSYSFRMSVLVDISESIRYYGKNLNWHSLVERSKEFKIGNCVYYSLRLAKEIMGLNIPTYVLDGLDLDPKLKPFEVKLLRMVIRRIVFAEHDFTQDLPSFPSDFMSFLYGTLSMELLHTLEARSRIRNIRSKCIRAFPKAFHRYIKKHYVPRVS